MTQNWRNIETKHFSLAIVKEKHLLKLSKILMLKMHIVQKVFLQNSINNYQNTLKKFNENKRV